MPGRRITPQCPIWICPRPSRKGLAGSIALVAAVAFLAPESGHAGDTLSSSNYQHVGGQFGAVAAAGDRALTSSANPSEWGAQSISIGENPTTQPSGRFESLRSLLPGFWAVVVGAFPTLDLDGDGAQFFLDADDDGDQIDDVFETGTGSFISATNTGTSPTQADTDGDGFDDGVEVAAGTDPTDPGSSPAPPEVPGLLLPLAPLAAMLAGLLGWTANRSGQRRRPDRTKPRERNELRKPQ